MICISSRIRSRNLLAAATVLLCLQHPSPATAQAAVTAAAPAAGGAIHGEVKAGGVPLPGVSVIATDDASGSKFATVTDANGTFSMKVPAGRSYTLRAEFAAFAPLTQKVQLTTQTDQAAEFSMQLASRAAAAKTAAVRTAIMSGIQKLSLSNSMPDAAPAAGAASVGADAGQGVIADPSMATDSVAVNGQEGSTNAFGNMSEDDIRQKVQDAISQARAQGAQPGDIASAIGDMITGMMAGAGGFGGGDSSGGHHHGGDSGGGGGHGSFRGFNPAQPHGSIFYQGGNSALDTKGFFIGGPPPSYPSYNSNKYGITIAGSPYIPGLFKPDLKQFVFLNFTGTKGSTQNIYNATVPTDGTNGTVDERDGYFAGTGTTLYQNNGVAFPNNQIPACATNQTTNCLTAQAKALLAYYPHPNVTNGLGTTNYQRVASPASDSNTVALRYVRNFGSLAAFGPHAFHDAERNGSKTLRQNINGNFNYQHAANDIYTAFPDFGGKSATNSLAFTAGYTEAYGHLTNNFSLTWNRSHAITSNYFTNNFNPANSDCNGVDPCFPLGKGTTQNNPLNYGIPSVSFAQFTGFNDTTPANKTNQTISFSESSSYNRHKHNIHAGFDVRRVHLDTLAGTNVLGSYTFSGYGTCEPDAASGGCTQNTGSDFADFLLGLPQQTAIQASNYKYYLRANVWDVYGQDDWRVNADLTLNYGLRYEYFSPYSEKYDRLANLDLQFGSSGLQGVDQVLPNQTGATGIKYPHTLVYPDRNNFAPRFGFAYKLPVIAGKDAVLRGGYGINYNTTQYSTFALRLANEPPFADTQTNIAGQNHCGTQATTPQFTWSSAFNCSTNVTIDNNYAIDPFYRLGYVQIWNMGVQRTMPGQIVFNLDYTGSKGTRLDMVRAPNRAQGGLAVPTAEAFNFEDAVAGSHLNSVTLNLRKRLHDGVALGATYTYAHSIDNASSIGGGGTVVAQDDQDLHAEEGNSSFDVRQKVTGNWLFELPFGPNTPLLNGGGVFSRIVEGWSISGDYTFATGTPLTPHYSNSAAEIARGSNGSYRPDRNPGVPMLGDGSYLHWLNNYAFFTTPGTEQNTGQCNEAVAGQYPAGCPFATPVTTPPSGSNPFGYGNASRNSIPGPGTVSINASISKTVQLGTTRSFEMRATAQNVFNTVQYSGVDTNLNSHTFGQITSVSSTRQVTVLARYRF